MTIKTMTTLNHNFTTWATALRSGDEHYLMITRTEDCWYLLSEHEAEPILSLEVLIDEGYGLRPEYSYFIDVPDNDGLMSSIIIRDRAQMILKDINGYYAFGITDEQAPADALLIYARTEEQCTVILANRHGCHVHIFSVEQVTSSSGLTL